MPLSLRIPHVVVSGVLIATVFVLGVIQAASDALNAARAASGAVPARIPVSFGRGVYELLDHLAPAPYVEATLARDALDRGDLADAQRYAVHLPASSGRNELLARIARARGDTTLAYEYFFVAADTSEVQRAILMLATNDPQTAYEREGRFRRYLQALATHPDAVADAYSTQGQIAQIHVWHDGADPARAALWARRALQNYEIALNLAPLNLQYVLETANQALFVGDLREAERVYRMGVDVDPSSADVQAGLGLVALARGERSRARAFAQHARALNPASALLRTLEHQLR